MPTRRFPLPIRSSVSPCQVITPRRCFVPDAGNAAPTIREPSASIAQGRAFVIGFRFQSGPIEISARQWSTCLTPRWRLRRNTSVGRVSVRSRHRAAASLLAIPRVGQRHDGSRRRSTRGNRCCMARRSSGHAIPVWREPGRSQGGRADFRCAPWRAWSSSCRRTSTSN
jgi:hypothetical protein